MFDRFVLASSFSRITKKFDMASLPDGEEYYPNYNIAPDDFTYVVKSELTVDPNTFSTSSTMQQYLNDKVPTKVIRKYKFGLMGVEKSIKYFVRAEGDRNQSNDLYYTGAKALFLDNRYKRLIRNNRCLVLADAFVVGINQNPFLVYLRDQRRPFSFAGLWNVAEDEKGLKTASFCVLTVPANPLLKRLGCDRMPVIIPQYQERKWLSKSVELSQVLSMLNSYPHNQMNAYPISNKIRDVKNNDVSVIQPIGGRIYNEKIEVPAKNRIRLGRN